ncbi:hypothetical protein J7426_23495 [Tropicibacter sp. R16_0]|uniref:type VI secretion system-associated protein TagO n=1 Tax=Tropicibacter sp. R16_0 TaxID=2821102 RepID=UPI001AD97406|nr:type VI secretion system-associated protein TagO [Tropicibacter sp. R16_0]MBO9453246.1 hypothetical protein [Tropicibacter sp. R16_0]
MNRICMLAGAAIASFAAFTAQAQDCKAIDNDLDRLACYDKASGRTPTVETDTIENSNWKIRTEKSEFEDTTDVYLRVDSEKPLTCGYGSPREATLILRCRENTTSLIIATSCHLASGHGGYGRVEYRIDDNKTNSRNFDESTNNRSLGLWNGRSSIPVIKQMLTADTFLTRFTPFGSNPQTAKFVISGLDEAIEPLRKACKW